MANKIVLLDMTAEPHAAQLRALLPPGFSLVHGTERGDEHMKSLIRDADFAIAAQVGVSGDVLRAATRLKLLHKWGVGVDNIDLDTARQLGIQVARTTGSNAVPVAEFTLGLMIASLRNLAYGHHQLQQGQWRAFNQMPADALLLSGKTVGIVGFGAIGQRVARLLQGFGCRILYAKRTPLAAAVAAEFDATHVSLQQLLGESDVVSLHCPLTPETTNMIDRAALARMKPTAVLVNVARGGVVVERDLAEVLRARGIRGAAMDVLSIEPLPAASELLSLDNIVVTPHIASATADTFEKNVTWMFDNMARVARGEPVPDRDRVV